MKKTKLRLGAFMMSAVMLFVFMVTPISASSIYQSSFENYEYSSIFELFAEDERKHAVVIESIEAIQDFMQTNNSFLVDFGGTLETVFYTSSGYEIISQISVSLIEPAIVGFDFNEFRPATLGRWQATYSFHVPHLLTGAFIQHTLVFDVTSLDPRDNWPSLRGVSCSIFATPPTLYSVNGSGSSIIDDRPSNVQSRGFATFSFMWFNTTIHSMIAVMPWFNGQINLQAWSF